MYRNIKVYPLINSKQLSNCFCQMRISLVSFYFIHRKSRSGIEMYLAIHSHYILCIIYSIERSVSANVVNGGNMNLCMSPRGRCRGAILQYDDISVYTRDIIAANCCKLLDAKDGPCLSCRRRKNN